MGHVFGRPLINCHQPLQGNQSDQELTGQAGNGEVNQSNEDGNGGVSSAVNQRHLQLTSQTANEGVNQSNQEGNGEVSSAVKPTDNQSNLHQLTRQSAANGGVNERNQEGNGGVSLAVTLTNNQEGNAGVKRADPIHHYEKELSVAWWWACIIGSLHACSQFLAVCNLTWATVVLLGAFVPNLVPLDFDFVVSLLLSEGARLSSASFFSRLLTRALAYLSQDPKRIKHNQDEHYPRAKWARNCSRIVQVIFILAGLIMPAFRVFIFQLDNHVNVRNLQKSLRIFYVSVFINSIVGLINLVCSPIASYYLTRKFPTEQSILRYFDKVLKNGMGFGVVQADDFDFFNFAFTMLAGEFRRNVQPEAVAKNHKELIQYMYAHRLGVDFVQSYLDAEDAFVRLAAVNMVGFWADTVWGVGVRKLRLPEELLTKLADKVGTGQVGWGATTSFGVVAASSQAGARIVARTCTTRGIRLTDRLANLVDDSSSRSLSLVRTLGEFYEKLCKDETAAPMPFESVDTNLVPKLKKLAGEAERHRLRVQAAYLLRLMDKECDSRVILAIDPTRDDYWFQSEVSMLQLLRRAINAPDFVFLDPKLPSINPDRQIDPPFWAQAIIQPTEQARGST